MTHLGAHCLVRKYVRKKEPKGAGATSSTINKNPESITAQSDTEISASDNNASASAGKKQTVSDAQLAALNQQIPEAKRPTSASVYLDSYFIGFPAVLNYKAVMVLHFRNGRDLACSAWDPLGDFPDPDTKQGKRCKFSGEKTNDTISGFSPGQRLELAFGTIRGSSIDGLSGLATSISGGDLLMSKSGEIAIGRWNVNQLSASAASARATSTKRDGLMGRYYLDGHTITVLATDGEVVHGFIGFSPSDEKAVGRVYMNGEHYWDRK